MQKKRGRGRPKREPVSAQELREKARAAIRSSTERRLGIKDLNVEEFHDDFHKITGKHKFSRKELDELREKVSCLYDKYMVEKWEEEAKVNAPYLSTLRSVALEGKDKAEGMMTPEEWNVAHGLRPDGSKKRGPAPKKKKTVWDLSPGEKGTADKPGEPIDLDAMEAELEARMMDEYIAQQKAQAPQLKGKRVRREQTPVQQRPERKSFWI